MSNFPLTHNITIEGLRWESSCVNFAAKAATSNPGATLKERAKKAEEISKKMAPLLQKISDFSRSVEEGKKSDSYLSRCKYFFETPFRLIGLSFTERGLQECFISSCQQEIAKNVSAFVQRQLEIGPLGPTQTGADFDDYCVAFGLYKTLEGLVPNNSTVTKQFLLLLFEKELYSDAKERLSSLDEINQFSKTYKSHQSTLEYCLHEDNVPPAIRERVFMIVENSFMNEKSPKAIYNAILTNLARLSKQRALPRGVEAKLKAFFLDYFLFVEKINLLLSEKKFQEAETELNLALMAQDTPEGSKISCLFATTNLLLQEKRLICLAMQGKYEEAESQTIELTKIHGDKTPHSLFSCLVTTQVKKEIEALPDRPLTAGEQNNLFKVALDTFTRIFRSQEKNGEVSIFEIEFLFWLEIFLKEKSLMTKPSLQKHVLSQIEAHIADNKVAQKAILNTLKGQIDSIEGQLHSFQSSFFALAESPACNSESVGMDLTQGCVRSLKRDFCGEESFGSSSGIENKINHLVSIFKFLEKEESYSRIILWHDVKSRMKTLMQALQNFYHAVRFLPQLAGPSKPSALRAPDSIQPVFQMATPRSALTIEEVRE